MSAPPRIRPNYAIDGENIGKGRVLRSLSTIRGPHPTWFQKIQPVLLRSYMVTRYWTGGGYRRQKLFAELMAHPVINCRFSHKSVMLELPQRLSAPAWTEILTGGPVARYLSRQDATNLPEAIVLQDCTAIVHDSVTEQLARRYGGEPVSMSGCDWMTAVIETGRVLVDRPPVSKFDQRETFNYGQFDVERLCRDDRCLPRLRAPLP